ncbi:MAG TPA: adenylate/guanylate cyclase domain-containing protein [Thermosynechococcaceae cyanobacterium]
MASLSLKRLLSKKDTVVLLHQILATVGQPIALCDPTGNVVLGDEQPDGTHQHLICVEGTTIGSVRGGEAAGTIAQLLNYLAAKELEKRTLAQETLDRYKEITLLYDLSEKISASLELNAVAELVLNEAQRLIAGDSGAVILVHPNGNVELIAAFGQGQFVVAQQSVLSTVLATRNGEIINDLTSDARSNGDSTDFCSMIVAPLKRQDGAIGLLCIGSQACTHYSAADLKLLNALASQAAAAIENALLHQNKLHEERIKSNLERYVPAQLVQAILDSGGHISLAPVRKDITILFSDIRNFTTQCEELAPETIVGYLNDYFTDMVEVIFAHKGTVNKFVGDMIVALFGAPAGMENHEVRAIETAIAMQQRLRAGSIPWIRDHFRTGIGIASGSVIVGNIGSPQHMDYTAIGDRVNTASRIQSIAQGGQILVSRSVYEAAHDRFEFKELGNLTVKGKRQTVEVLEVLY